MTGKFNPTEPLDIYVTKDIIARARREGRSSAWMIEEATR